MNRLESVKDDEINEVINILKYHDSIILPPILTKNSHLNSVDIINSEYCNNGLGLNSSTLINSHNNHLYILNRKNLSTGENNPTKYFCKINADEQFIGNSDLNYLKTIPNLKEEISKNIHIKQKMHEEIGGVGNENEDDQIERRNKSCRRNFLTKNLQNHLKLKEINCNKEDKPLIDTNCIII